MSEHAHSNRWEYRTAVTSGDIDWVRWSTDAQGQAAPLPTAFEEWATQGWELVANNALPSGNVQYIFRRPR